MKGKILIIENEADLLSMLQFQLTSAGYQVAVASDGQQGLARLQEIEPDLIILDLNMTQMGGLEFCRKIRAEENRTRYPILVLTAVVNREQLLAEFELAGLMSKPFEIHDLLKKVEAVIQEKS